MVLLLTCVIASGCSADDPLPAALEATVTIEAQGCSMVSDYGTGVAVTHQGSTVIVTSAHTVAGAATILVHTDRAVHQASVLAFDPDRDLAVLDAPEGLTGRQLIQPTAALPATVIVRDPAAQPRSIPSTITRLLRVTIEDIYLDDKVTRQAFELPADIKPGDSGAPVFTFGGDILGVIYARSRSRPVGFAVSSVEIRELLDHAVHDAAHQEPSSVGRCL